MLPAPVQAWRDRGELLELGGREVFAFRRPEEGVPILLLHGFPSSSFDWRALVGRLPGRDLAGLDLLGFGLSEKPRERNSLFVQADLVEALAARWGIERALVVGHDMGTSVATELLARDLEGRLGFGLDGMLLFNGSIVVEAASLTWEQKLLRSQLGFLLSAAANERMFRRGLGATFSDPHPLSAEEARCQWALLAHRGGHRRLHLMVSYIDERIRHAERWHGALAEWPGRLELAWGLRDPVATTEVLAAVRELRPVAPVRELAELGHYPQVEDPGAIAAAVEALASPA